MIIKVNLGFGRRAADRSVRRGDLIIIVDVLRSTTTIVHALANGVESIVPIKTLKEAYKLHKDCPDFILVGERRCQKPRGFDFNNSPSDLGSKDICGKKIIITTTSGTRVLTHSLEDKWSLIGAFLNAKLVANKATDIAEKKEINVSFVLAGEKGRFSLEDYICAGAIVERFPPDKVKFSANTSSALLSFKNMKHSLLQNIMKTEHARQLLKLGFRRDIELSCKLDTVQIVPIYKKGEITIL